MRVNRILIYLHTGHPVRQRLEVPTSLVGLEGVTISGMAFTLYGGRGWWDRAGVRHNSWRATKYYRFNGQVVAMRKNGVLTYLHGDHLGSTFLTTNSSGAALTDEGYYAYGRYRRGGELGTTTAAPSGFPTTGAD